MPDQESNSVFLWLILIGGAVLIYNCSGDEGSSSTEEVEYVADELNISAEYADELLQGYSSPEDAIDDYRSSFTPNYGTGFPSVDGDLESESYDDSPAEQYRQPFDEDAARRKAEREMSLQGYDYSYGCTIDCSGHEAGWRWRAENGYPTYGSLDYGNSQSFAEGARAYEEAVDERVESLRNDYDLGDDYPY